ncbi:MAG TPA: MFS transporter [Polyangiales bacterium]|nr:MFS transporter [Polyangiales bacterium]
MTPEALRVQRVYLLLTLLSTLAASLIWGINTLFLLDAGLNNTEAFAANAFFTAGEVLFEIPTGVVADLWGRRASYLLGSATLLVSTLLYLLMWQMHAPLWAWAIASMLLGLGFTFFSGATEAWLVDALAFAGYKDALDRVLSRAQIVTGAAMLTGTAFGAYLAQLTNLGVPYIVRSALLGLTLIAALIWMHDLGFTPQPRDKLAREVRAVLRASIDNGWRRPPVRWLMLSGLCSGGVGIYAFYSLQPYLLQLYGDTHAFALSGLAAALISGSQIASGLLAPQLRRIFTRRSDVLLVSAAVVGLSLWGLGAIPKLGFALSVVVVWSLAFWVAMPMRQTLLNGMVPSSQRATVLSFDNLMSSAGGVFAQPALGRVADVSGYGAAYVVCAAIQLTSIPFLALARREKPAADAIALDSV